MAGPAGEVTRAAAGETQLFERISITHVTDSEGRADTGGVALVDVDRDGRIDLFIAEQAGPIRRSARLLRNTGCFEFDPVALTFDVDSAGSNSVPVLVNLDDDEPLELLVTRAGGVNSLYDSLPQGYTAFADRSTGVGLSAFTNGYNRQPAIADVTGDGFLDIAIAGDQIGSIGQRPTQRLYVYDSPSQRFRNVAGSAVAEGFGEAPDVCSRTTATQTDRGSPGILVRDLDDDGDVDIVQPAHRDLLPIVNATDPCRPGLWAQGVWAWRNDAGTLVQLPFGAGGGLSDTDEVLAERALTTGYTAAGGYTYDREATSLPYISAADVDNDGDLDIAITGASDPEWHGQPSHMTGKFWRNLGGWRFRAETTAAGLDGLNDTYGEWATFWGVGDSFPTSSAFVSAACSVSVQRTECQRVPFRDHQAYGADLVFADFDNDGWQDLVHVNRHEFESGERWLRNMLYRNRGDGTFERVGTPVSGIDTNSIAAETGDLNDDGLLDLFFVASPSNSDGSFPLTMHPDRYLDKVYWNTGRQFGAAANHWIRVRLTGLPTRQLVGARIYAQTPGTSTCTGSGETRTCVGRRDYFPVSSYKSSHDLEAHFGLGARVAVDVRVVLPGGASRTFSAVPIDATLTLNVMSGAVASRAPEGRIQ